MLRFGAGERRGGGEGGRRGGRKRWRGEEEEEELGGRTVPWCKVFTQPRTQSVFMVWRSGVLGKGRRLRDEVEVGEGGGGRRRR